MVRNRKRDPIGPTGEYPEGRPLAAGDQGGLRGSLRWTGTHFILDFGKSITWVAFTPAEARHFATELLRLADQKG